METGSGRKIKYSVRTQFLAVFSVAIAALVVFMCTYPVMAARDLVFSTKESSMLGQATVMSSSLSALEDLSISGVAQVMELMDVTALDRVIVTDDEGLILYDTSEFDSSVGKYAMLSEINLALEGRQTFYSKFDGASFMSRQSLPVSSRGTVIGAVYLYERDAQQAGFINGIARNMRNISIFAGLVAIALLFVLTHALTLRITDLASAVRRVRDGDYSVRMQARGADEVTELISEFNDLTERLEDTETMRRRFVSDASHELKTPLAAIRLLTDSVVQTEQMDRDTMLEFVSDIGDEATRLQRLTEKLLDLTRMDGQEQRAQAAPVDMKRVAERTMHMLLPLAAKMQVELRFDLGEGCVILAQEDDIYQMIFNLIENGIKYNVPGGAVDIALGTRYDRVVLTVEDTGIGVPPEDMPYIFQRFYRVDKARSRASGGSGLGLAIVRTVAEACGGQVTARPGEERGTCFTVVLPRLREEGTP